MIWLLNSLEEKISDSVMFLTTAKEMWYTLKVMYDNKKNSSRVFEIYECLFELKQRDKFMAEFYGKLKGLIDELKMHQPAVTDAVTLRGYHQDLAVSKFLFVLSPTLRSQVRGHILRKDSIPTLTAIFFRACVFLLKLMYPLHHLLVTLRYTLDVVEVEVVAATMEEDVA